MGGRQSEAVSVLILTKNERQNLPQAVRSLRSLSSDIHVLDSFSTDGTQAWARAEGLTVYERMFDDWGSHSNWALSHIPFKHRWVYYADADEVVPSELAEEIRAAVAHNAGNHVAYQVRYINYFRGSWLTHGAAYPVWVTRLFMHDAVRYEIRSVNAHPTAIGSVGRLENQFLHYTFCRGLQNWLEKHNSYSTYEAAEGQRVLAVGPIRWPDVAARIVSRGDRRRAFKELAFRIQKGRGASRFVHSYILRRGFLDGAAGLHYAFLLAIYEDWIERKLRVDEMGRLRLEATIAADIAALADGRQATALGALTARYLRFVLAADRKAPWGRP